MSNIYLYNIYTNLNIAELEKSDMNKSYKIIAIIV
jgi:hypothetical protein